MDFETGKEKEEETRKEKEKGECKEEECTVKDIKTLMEIF